ncbi:Conserved_hypothetical protein [Hexamita inflata]|uniref:Lipid-binding serum glycoprotein N-terminal domain-containing protein n=1 Tax=Hexamita inflata TaxID=28002 RepID=A0AA86V3D6_9EUKA|nr:Conserved hypothetical protein [Hexamita inflata]
MLLYILAEQRNCELGYSKILGPQDTAQTTTATRRGASKFMLCGIKDGFGAVMDIIIPDQHMSFDVGVSQVDFTLSDIKIADLQVPDIQFDLNDGQQSQMSVLNCSVVIKFQWRLQQQSYPYINDFGSGKIMVTNGEMKGVVNSTADVDQCPGHMIIGFVRASIDYESLQVQLDGGDSWLFQSIINLVLSEIEDELMGTLTNVLLKGFIDLINNVFEDNRRVVEFHGYPDIIKDERYTSGVFTSSAGYVALRISGYVYNKNNLKDDFVTPQKLNPFTLNKFNNDFQIAIHEAAINNAFYTFHKYNNTYSGPTYQVLEPPTIKFMNAAGVLSINVLANNSEVKLRFIAKLQHENDVNIERCYVFFTFEKYEVEVVSENSVINVEQLQNEVISHMNAVIKYAAYQLSYTHFTDLNEYTHMFDPIERVIRFVGPEEFICPLK